MAIDVLLVGSGGREHALAWKLKQSPRMGKLYIAPGNAGTAQVGENVPIDVLDFPNLARFVEDKKIGLTVVSMDDPLAGGIVDFFRARRLRIWGPTKAAAQIEWSKSFAKELMREAKIPTAEFKVFNAQTPAFAYIRVRKLPVVIKASGLALGKGVYICRTLEEADMALREIFVDRVHKDAGNEVVIEDFLEGPEISVHALCDDISHIVFPPSQDHKRAQDGDVGKNTGGMGAIAPIPWLSMEEMSHIDQAIVRKTLDALSQKSAVFSGILYPGLKLTMDGPKVLEFNARFGDPEAQVYMRLLQSDILDLFEACVDMNLTAFKDSIKWNHGFAVNIVIASGGYPDAYQKGFPITGIEDAEKIEGVVVFHAGTTLENGSFVTNGGRVLGVSAVASTLIVALKQAYEAVGKIHFEGMQYRHDIGKQALEYYSAIRV